ncbi:MAG: hypothetical protein HRT58_04845 [Crocinitomicaceae bacterium]|nr:hypothetical protein [Flavobacteriales bacterium]NQZ34966.1 hypothetical protein [Crocinitomicaceae bacterium]
MRRITLIFGAVLSLIVLMSAMKSVRNVDLSSKGIPITVDAPTGSVIKGGVLNGMVMEGVTTFCWDINNGDFSLEVTMEDEDLRQSRYKYVQYSKNVLEMDVSFVEYVESDENGFLAKMDFGGIIEYEFYHLVIKNNRAIEFSTGLSTSDYSRENIRNIYYAAKTAK